MRRARKGSDSDPAHELVVDRVRNARVRLREHAVPEQHDRRADGQLAVELDRERVHRHRPDDTPGLARDPHLGARQVTAEAVPVADGHDADPGGSLRDEAPAVTGALPWLEPLHLRERRLPRQDGLEPVFLGIRVERRQSVHRDPAAGRVEV